MNFMRIKLRDKSQAAAKISDFEKLTTKELLCWFHRTTGNMLSYRHHNIWYDYNASFDHHNPLGYQWSRVQVDDNYRNPFENTRQYMCLYCQEPSFFKLTGPESIFFHLQLVHPWESPSFVTNVIQVLGLLPQRGPHSCGEVRIPFDKGFFTEYWSDLEYFQDGESNKLCYHRTSRLTNSNDRLDSVNQRKVKPWYSRDIKDFEKYQHRNVVYAPNPDFDIENPAFYQISRVLSLENGKILPYSRQLLCMYCRQPRFFSLFCQDDYFSHLARNHFPVDLPDSVTACKPVFEGGGVGVIGENANELDGLTESEREKRLDDLRRFLVLCRSRPFY